MLVNLWNWKAGVKIAGNKVSNKVHCMSQLSQSVYVSLALLLYSNALCVVSLSILFCLCVRCLELTSQRIAATLSQLGTVWSSTGTSRHKTRSVQPGWIVDGCILQHNTCPTH